MPLPHLPTTAATATLLVATLLPCALRAGDVQPDDYIAPEPGVQMVLNYTSATRSRHLRAPDGDTAVDVDSYAITFRYVHAFALGQHVANVNVLLPLVHVPDGRIASQRAAGASGFGDPQLVSTLWLVNAPQRRQHVAVAAYLTLPLGRYDRMRAINPGGNRWSGMLQAAYRKEIHDALAVELVADATWHADNDEAHGGTTLAQDATFSAQVWLQRNLDDRTYVAVGYSASGGGEQRLDGVDTGVATRYRRLRIAAARAVRPGVQLYGEIGTDLARERGLEQDLGVLVRVMKVF